MSETDKRKLAHITLLNLKQHGFKWVARDDTYAEGIFAYTCQPVPVELDGEQYEGKMEYSLPGSYRETNRYSYVPEGILEDRIAPGEEFRITALMKEGIEE